MPRPDLSAAGGGRDQTPASNPHEELLASVCREVLGKPRIGVRESLFDLGADSLHVYQIVARAGRAGLKLAPQQIMEHRTIAAICAAAEASTNGTHDSVVPRLAPVPRELYHISAHAFLSLPTWLNLGCHGISCVERFVTSKQWRRPPSRRGRVRLSRDRRPARLLVPGAN